MKANWFIGLPVAASEWLPAVLADAPAGVRLFHPDDVHLTVAFLGRCGQPAARKAWAVVETYDGKAFDIELAELRPFGNPLRPSALSVVLSAGQQQVVALIQQLRDPLCEAAGARLETRAPSPHVTVARPAKHAKATARQAAVTWAESKAPVDVRLTIDRLALYTWSEDRRERQFRQVAVHPLS